MDNPLILVFYLDRQLMSDKSIFPQYAQYINHIIESKGANIIALFIPTDGEEHVECLNPKLLEKPDMERVNSLIADIVKNFSIGDESDKHDLDKISDDELESDEDDDIRI